MVKVTGADAVPNQGRLCVKGRFGYDFIQSEDRLTMPLIKVGDRFREGLLGGGPRAGGRGASRRSGKNHGPNSLGGLTSARVTNEENYLMQKLVRAGFGTNNIDHCARL